MWISTQPSICSRGAGLGYPMDPVLSVQNKNFRKPREACKSSRNPRGNPKSFTLTIPWNLAKFLKIFPGIIVRWHNTDRKQMGLLREQYAEWKKVRLQYCRSQVWMKIGGQIPWNAVPICETFKISCLMGKLHTKGVLENLSQDQSLRLVHWLSITLFLRKTSQESINLEIKSYLDCSSDTLCTRWEFGRVTYWLQTLRSLETIDASEIDSKRLNAKEVIFPKQGEFFPIADGRKKIGGDQDLRTSTSIRHRPIQGESNIDFLGESKGSLPPPPHDSFPDAGEAINDFWSMSGKFIYRHHVEPRVKLYSPREESFPIPLKYIDVSRTTHTNLDVMQERRIDDCWNIDGIKRFVWFLDRFHSIYFIGRKTLQTDMWSRGRLTRKQLTSRPDHLWPELWIKLGRSAKLKEKQKWSNEKPKLNNARRWRGIYFIDPEDKEFKETIRNARKNWKHQWLPPCLARHARKARMGRPVARLMISNQNLRVSWRPVNPRECVWKNLYQITMRTISQERVTIHYNITVWYTNLFPCLKQWRYPQQK